MQVVVECIHDETAAVVVHKFGDETLPPDWANALGRAFTALLVDIDIIGVGSRFGEKRP